MSLENELSKYPVGLSVSDISEILGLSKQSIYNMIRTDSMPSVSIGKRRVIMKDTFIHWLKTQESNANGQ